MTAADIDVQIERLHSILNTITASPQPDYSVDGETVSWDRYKSNIIADIERLVKLKRVIGGPWEVRHRGR